MINMRRVDEAVHRRIDRRRRTTLAVQAVVERRDHLVFALDSGIDVHQPAHPIEAQHREAGFGQGAKITAGTLHPDQLDRLAGDRIGLSCPWPRCCLRRSWCSWDPIPAGSTERSALQLLDWS